MSKKSHTDALKCSFIKIYWNYWIHFRSFITTLNRHDKAINVLYFVNNLYNSEFRGSWQWSKCSQAFVVTKRVVYTMENYIFKKYAPISFLLLVDGVSSIPFNMVSIFDQCQNNKISPAGFMYFHRLCFLHLTFQTSKQARLHQIQFQTPSYLLNSPKNRNYTWNS